MVKDFENSPSGREATKLGQGCLQQTSFLSSMVGLCLQPVVKYCPGSEKTVTVYDKMGSVYEKQYRHTKGQFPSGLSHRQDQESWRVSEISSVLDSLPIHHNNIVVDWPQPLKNP